MNGANFIQGDSLSAAFSPEEARKKALVDALMKQETGAGSIAAANNGTALGALGAGLMGGMQGMDDAKKNALNKQAAMGPWMPTVTMGE